MTNERTKNAISRTELKERIISVSTEAFKTHGVRGITMDDIATQMGISKRTIYELFADKEALLEQCIMRGRDEQEAYLQSVRRTASNVLEVLLHMFLFSVERFHSVSKKFFDDIRKYPKAYACITEKQRKDSENMMTFFNEGVRQGIFRDDVNYPIVHMLLVSQLDRLMDDDMRNQYPIVEVYESIIFTFIRGISTEKGACELDRFIAYYRRNGHSSVR